MTPFTTSQIKAIQAASVLIDEPALEINESLRRKTARGDKNVVTGKKGNYEYLITDGKPIGRLYYVSSYSLKQATAAKQNTFAGYTPTRNGYSQPVRNRAPEIATPARRRLSQTGMSFSNNRSDDQSDLY